MRQATVVVLLILSACSVAQPITPKAALERLFTAKPIQPEWFTSDFTERASVDQLTEIFTAITDQLGDYRRVEGSDSPFTVIFEGGTATAQIALDAQARIRGLFLSNLTPNVGSVADAIDKLAVLPGQVGAVVLENGKELAALNADAPLAAGSTFKLIVLSVLQDQIRVGLHTWSEVVTLKPEWKSLPTGILQDWPDNTPLTIQTLATLMISQSDNTATDALINVVGREAIEVKTQRNQPFLTTREAFLLKFSVDGDTLNRYLKGDKATKRAVLLELQKLPLPAARTIPTEPTRLEIEWVFSVRELCDLMAEVQDIPLMTATSDITNLDEWARVAYKGGSEPGVLNLTAWLTAKNGNAYCVSVSQTQNSSINKADLISIYNGLLGVLQ